MPLDAGPQQAVEAFDDLYRSSRDDVYSYVATILRDRAAAEDVTASAFERAYRKRRSFSARRGSPRSWLFGIARNAALDELRRRGRHASLAAEPVAAEWGASLAHAPQEAAERSAQADLVRRAVAALTPRERELVALKFFAGLTNGEIARVISTSESNAGTMLHRVLKKLREACYETA